MPMHPSTIRPAVPSDVPAITAILNHFVVHSTATFITDPVTEEDRLQWLTDRDLRHPVIVAETREAVVAWGSLGPFRPRAAYAHTVEASVYVHPDHHRCGFGRALLSELLNRARQHQHHMVIGACCSESVASLALLDAFGFSRAGRLVEVGRKHGRWLDVDFLQLRL